MSAVVKEQMLKQKILELTARMNALRAYNLSDSENADLYPIITALNEATNQYNEMPTAIAHEEKRQKQEEEARRQQTENIVNSLNFFSACIINQIKSYTEQSTKAFKDKLNECNLELKFTTEEEKEGKEKAKENLANNFKNKVEANFKEINTEISAGNLEEMFNDKVTYGELSGAEKNVWNNMSRLERFAVVSSALERAQHCLTGEDLKQFESNVVNGIYATKAMEAMPASMKVNAYGDIKNYLFSTSPSKSSEDKSNELSEMSEKEKDELIKILKDKWQITDLGTSPESIEKIKCLPPEGLGTIADIISVMRKEGSVLDEANPHHQYYESLIAKLNKSKESPVIAKQ